MRRIKRAVPKTEILVLSAHESEDLIEQIFESGAKGYVRKAGAGRWLVAALRSLQVHKPFLTDETSAMLFSRFLNTDAGGKKNPDRRRQTPPKWARGGGGGARAGGGGRRGARAGVLSVRLHLK